MIKEFWIGTYPNIRTDYFQKKAAKNLEIYDYSYINEFLRDFTKYLSEAGLNTNVPVMNRVFSKLPGETGEY